MSELLSGGMDIDSGVQSQPEVIPKAPKPHDFLWLPDGNVILATDTFLFKVHKSLLSLHSTVFKDMFELPYEEVPGGGQNSNSAGISTEVYDGLPLVTLVGDDGQDVAHLLRAVYERCYYDRCDDRTPLSIITALLLLSTKYDFTDIRRDVILQISKHYPMALKEFDAVDEADTPIFGLNREKCHFPLLVAAFKANVDVLLPGLFFSCSQYDVKEIFSDARSAQMSPECLRILIEGRDEVELDTFKFIAELPDDLLEMGEDDSNECLAKQTELCPKRARYHGLSERFSDSFSRMRGDFLVENHLDPVCKGCTIFVASAIDQRRGEIWEEVPRHYGYQNWDALQAKLKEMERSRHEDRSADDINASQSDHA